MQCGRARLADNVRQVAKVAVGWQAGKEISRIRMMDHDHRHDEHLISEKRVLDVPSLHVLPVLPESRAPEQKAQGTCQHAALSFQRRPMVYWRVGVQVDWLPAVVSAPPSLTASLLLDHDHPLLVPACACLRCAFQGSPASVIPCLSPLASILQPRYLLRPASPRSLHLLLPSPLNFLIARRACS